MICDISVSIKTMERFCKSGTSTNSAKAPKAKICPITSSDEVVDFQSHSGSGECCQRSGSESCEIKPRLSKERAGKPGTGLTVYNLSIDSKASRTFAKASASLVTAYLKISPPKYMEVHRPSLSESDKYPVVIFP